MTAPTIALTQEEELHWLALILVCGLGARRTGRLIEKFRTPQEVFRASANDLAAAGAPGSAAQSIASGCTFEDAVIQQQKMREAGAVAIPLTDPRYPQPLREIFDPPLVLFARGRVELLGTLTLAIVGTRRASTYGVAVTERLSADLSRAGLTIASGMARGIDTAAHRAALAAGGNTVAVFGCGVDVVYPAENRRLAAELAVKGLLLSEFPMGSPAHPQNFPIRNRVISGMSKGVIVVEGGQYSGSSITAKLAMEQGRELFAVPGNITNKLSWGPNLLIKQGAKLVQDWNDVIEELPAEDRRTLIREGQSRILAEGGQAAGEAASQAALPFGPNSEIARAALGRLQADTPTHIDKLLETLENYSSSEIIAALFELEMLGLVRQLPGRNFVKVW
jgi:DNA processing protein